MTDPEDLVFHLVKALRLPPWLTTTSSATGLSHAYDRFCVASDGYRDLFVRKGVPPEKIVVTGIPNFDHCDRFLKNSFPHRDMSSSAAPTFARPPAGRTGPRSSARWSESPPDGRFVWKLHPNENPVRARAELAWLAPGAQVFEAGSAEEMIANCDVLITQFSSTAYVGLALGKEVHSYFDVEELRRLCPIQNGRTSAKNIANVCRQLLGLPENPQLPSLRQEGKERDDLAV